VHPRGRRRSRRAPGALRDHVRTRDVVQGCFRDPRGKPPSGTFGIRGGAPMPSLLGGGGGGSCRDGHSDPFHVAVCIERRLSVGSVALLSRAAYTLPPLGRCELDSFAVHPGQAVDSGEVVANPACVESREPPPSSMRGRSCSRTKTPEGIGCPRPSRSICRARRNNGCGPSWFEGAGAEHRAASPRGVRFSNRSYAVANPRKLTRLEEPAELDTKAPLLHGLKSAEDLGPSTVSPHDRLPTLGT
jgi:hypothetical protein